MLNDPGEGDICDFYGPCDSNPLGKEEILRAGGFMSYSAKALELFLRAVIAVDRILRGGKPADFPIEHPTKFELVIHLKAAAQIGPTISLNVLARANRVIR